MSRPKKSTIFSPYFQLIPIQVQKFRPCDLVDSKFGDVFLQSDLYQQLTNIVRVPLEHLQALRFHVLAPEFVFIWKMCLNRTKLSKGCKIANVINWVYSELAYGLGG